MNEKTPSPSDGPKKPDGTKSSTPGSSTPPSKPAAASPSSSTPTSGPVPPLFRSIDWWTFAITFAIVAVIYFLTLAPEVTLEDSGELCTGAFWAGIPHPPGYPFWSIYSWFWTVLVPFKNVAFRVELGESAAAVMACSLAAIMVSRGSSMFIEGIENLRGITRKSENAICIVCGITAGLLLAMGSSMWKESVVINRISPFGVPWLTLVLVCMMRWIYAPHQRRYLYVAIFFFGICTTIHQTLMVAAMALEIGITARDEKLGRDCWFFNSITYLALLFGMAAGLLPGLTGSNPMVVNIIHAVGIGSIVMCIWLVIRTGGLLSEWTTGIILIVVAVAGFSFYFYEPLAGMTNPPMEWGYPRTPEGFFHALTRGQYDKVSPTNIFAEPMKFVVQLGMLFNGLADAFSWVYVFIAVLPIFFLFRMRKREQAWIITVASVYPFLGILLTIFLDPTPDRQMADLVKVFYTASHADVAILIGYGLSLTAAYMATHYQSFRLWGIIGGVVAVALAIFLVFDVTGKNYFGLEGWPDDVGFGEKFHWIAQSFAPNQYGLPVFGILILLGLTLVFVAAVLVYRQRAPLAITLAIFLAMPLYSGFSHWFHSEQRNHWFGYWFGHDMFTPPYKDASGNLSYDASGRDAAAKGPYKAMVYPEMARDAVLFGGTDPGRFCPTYMIFCESFIPFKDQPEQDQHFNRRDVYIITQNALADNTYLDYIRAQFFRSAQEDPPFFQNLLATAVPKVVKGPIRMFAFLDYFFEGNGARIERRRRTESSLFKPDSFTDFKSFEAKLHNGQNGALAKYLYGRLSSESQKAVDNAQDDSSARHSLARDLNAILKGGNIYEAQRFQNIPIPTLISNAVANYEDQLPAGPARDNMSLRLNRVLLESAFPTEIAKSLGGVYPDTEIYTPSPIDSQECFNAYISDAERRLDHDQRFPNEPRQLKQGEEVHMAPGGGFQVAGQIAVMSINGLLTKVIFDHNPDHEFYVEESFPLDWMYPYLTPFGVIMKINRQPLAELTQDIIDKDHAFWSEYSSRTVGNFITYDTSISNICAFCERTYLRHDYTGFTGDRKFVRDDDAQKAFSKLRSSIGASIYWWRATHAANPADGERNMKEAEFALKQAFAYCPYSPEAVFHLMQLLLDARHPRLDDAISVLKTCHALDPYNTQMSGWLNELQANKQHGSSNGGVTIDQFMQEVQKQLAANNTNGADEMLDQILRAPNMDAGTLVRVADAYLKMGNLPKSEAAITRLTQVVPDSSEAWYNLAIIQGALGKTADSVKDLQKADTLNQAERAKDPKIQNIHDHLMNDPNLAYLRQSPEFQAAFGPKK